jgi:hypothetical protein
MSMKKRMSKRQSRVLPISNDQFNAVLKNAEYEVFEIMTESNNDI